MPSNTASTQPWPYPSVLAHRGGGTLAPENTLAGFREGVRYGYRAAECDVKLSADNVCFLLHDDTVDRTTNGHGSAAKMSMAQLAQLDAGHWKGGAYAGEPLPTLANIAAFCQSHAVALNLEIKPCPGRESETGHHVALRVRQLWAGAAVPPVLSSFEPLSLQAALHAAPELPRALLIDGVIPGDWLQRLQALQCIALHCDHAFLTQELAQAIKAAGYAILCYTVNDLEVAARLWAWGVDTICTDRIDLFSFAG